MSVNVIDFGKGPNGEALLKYTMKNENGTVSSLVSREEFYSAKSEQIVEDSYSGSPPAFVAAFISRRNISAQDADEIRNMIESFRKGENP